jgi:hypothetical protein
MKHLFLSWASRHYSFHATAITSVILSISVSHQLQSFEAGRRCHLAERHHLGPVIVAIWTRHHSYDAFRGAV